jgi:hypothetical protein
MQRIEGAKNEKKLLLYTTMELPQTIQIVHGFVEKYPFLDLELYPLETEANHGSREHCGGGFDAHRQCFHGDRAWSRG